jgi:phosphoribosyl 1,2-cyclic phosphate phosphodiesterase
LKVTFLGTGTSQGVPVIACNCKVCNSNNPKDKRLRSSVLIETESKVIVIDAGPDFRYQMLRENVKKLDAIILTHGHKDHVAGLDDVRAFNYIQKKHMDIYAQENVNKLIENEFDYAFHVNKYPGVPEFNLHTIENKPFKIDNISILPIEVMHYKLPVFGYRIGDFAYISDAKSINEKEKMKLKGAKVIVVNALRMTAHISHFTLKEALSLLEELKPERGYLTHISHQMGLHDEIQKELPDKINFAFDTLSIKI